MMIQKVILLLVGVVFASLSLGSDGAGNAERKYIGPSSAIGVCEAVIENDADRLRHELNAQRRRMLFGYSHRLRSHEIAGSFTCNDMELLDFSVSIGADDITRYLEEGGLSH